MQYLLLVYIDDTLLSQLPQQEFDTQMKQCLEHADALQAEGKLIAYRQLEAPSTARTVRTRNKKVAVLDGPFAETKEVLAGFNLVEASSMEEAERMAREDYPWSRFGSIEVRPVRDINGVRARVGA